MPEQQRNLPEVSGICGERAICNRHMGLEREIANATTQIVNLEKEKDLQRAGQESLSARFAELKGFIDGSVPKLQNDLHQAFRLLDEARETAEIYHGQVREMTGKVETVSRQLDGKASVELKSELEKLATKEEVKNCYTWVKGGFVAVAIIGLLWALTVVASYLGVPGP